MYIILSIVMVILGITMFLKPEIMYYLTESWKSYSSEPSDLYKVSTKFGGMMFTIVGVVGLIVFVFFKQ